MCSDQRFEISDMLYYGMFRMSLAAHKLQKVIGPVDER